MSNALVDRETRLNGEDHSALRLWLRLLTCSTLIESTIRRRLHRDFDITLPRFDLLAQLARSDGLRMNELSRRMMVTSGNVTGIAAQLERDGWISRETASTDRRAAVVRLTPDGRRRFREMADEHERWVVELIGTLETAEQESLRRLLGKLKTGIAANAVDPP